MTQAVANIGAFLVLAVAVGALIETLDHAAPRIIAALRGRPMP